MAAQPSETRQSYIDALQFRNTISDAIENSTNATRLQQNLIKWASPTLIRDSKGGVTRKYSDKFLNYCSDERYVQYTAGKTPTQISLEKINSCNQIIQTEADSRKLLRTDLALCEARLKELYASLPPTEQTMSLEELMAIQAGQEPSPRYTEGATATHTDASETESADTQAIESAIDAALHQ